MIDVENGKDSRLQELARLVAATRMEKHSLESQLSELGKLLDTHERNLWDALDEAGLSAIKVEGLGTLAKSAQTYWRVADELVFFAWLKETHPSDFTGMVKQTIHPQTLRGFCNELVRGGAEPPVGLDSYVKPTITVRREKT